MKLRHQLAAYSPITGEAVWAALSHGLGISRNGREHLVDLLARVYEAESVMLFGSGTGALQAALRAARRQTESPGVVLPAFTCFDVAAAAVALGSRIRLYDLEPHSLSPDLDSLHRAIDDEHRVVVVAPLYGMPVDWEAVAQVASRAGGIMVEDAAQGQGAKWRGRPLGALGPLSVISFGRGKGHTGGAGGAVLLRFGHGWTNGDGRPHPTGLGEELRVATSLAAQWALGRPEVYGLPKALPWLHLGETVYRSAGPPRPMTRAACGSVQTLWAAAELEAAERRANASAFLEALTAAKHVTPIRPSSDAIPGFLRLPVRMGHGLSGFSNSSRALALGVAPSYPRILADLQPVRARMDTNTTRWPGAAELSRTLFTLPTHSRMRPEERDELIGHLRTYRT